MTVAGLFHSLEEMHTTIRQNSMNRANLFAQLEKAQVFSAPIVTRLESLAEFFVAEAYHQNYAALNPGQPYIQGVSTPKVEKLREAAGHVAKRPAFQTAKDLQLDRDAHIDFYEYALWVRQAEPGVGEEELRERFAELNKDDDGRVELAELHAHLHSA